jgi:replicative DNA helicase
MTTLPYSKEAEEALLGAVLLNPDVIIELDIDASDFYVHKNSMVWIAASTLFNRNVKPDMVTLTEELEQRKQLSEVGGSSFLAALLNWTPSALRAHEYADIVREHAQRRRAIQIATEIVKIAHDEKKDLGDAIAGAVDKLTQGIRPKIGAQHISAYLDGFYERVLERGSTDKDDWGIPTGFIDYDKATGGGQAGEVLYLAGEPGIGKSILAMQMGIQMAEKGAPGVIYSIEMGSEQVIQRMVSAKARVETRKIKRGKMEGDEWTDFNTAIDELTGTPLYLCDASYLTTTSMRADLARLKLRHDIRWFVLDYLFLMSDHVGKDDDNYRTAMLSRRVKSIAREMKLFGITVNSVTKDGMDIDKTPSKKSLRGSGQMIHDADIVAFLVNHIPDQYEKANDKLRTFVFSKGREMENPRQHFHLVKHEKYPAFGNYAKEKLFTN